MDALRCRRLLVAIGPRAPVGGLPERAAGQEGVDQRRRRCRSPPGGCRAWRDRSRASLRHRHGALELEPVVTAGCEEPAHQELRLDGFDVWRFVHGSQLSGMPSPSLWASGRGSAGSSRCCRCRSRQRRSPVPPGGTPCRRARKSAQASFTPSQPLGRIADVGRGPTDGGALGVGRTEAARPRALRHVADSGGRPAHGGRRQNASAGQAEPSRCRSPRRRVPTAARKSWSRQENVRGAGRRCPYTSRRRRKAPAEGRQSVVDGTMRRRGRHRGRRCRFSAASRCGRRSGTRGALASAGQAAAVPVESLGDVANASRRPATVVVGERIAGACTGRPLHVSATSQVPADARRRSSERVEGICRTGGDRAVAGLGDVAGAGRRAADGPRRLLAARREQVLPDPSQAPEGRTRRRKRGRPRCS